RARPCLPRRSSMRRWPARASRRPARCARRLRGCVDRGSSRLLHQTEATSEQGPAIDRGLIDLAEVVEREERGLRVLIGAQREGIEAAARQLEQLVAQKGGEGA